MTLSARALRTSWRWLFLTACASSLCATGCGPSAPEAPVSAPGELAARSGWFHLPEGWRQLDYAELEGMALIEGDILVPLPGQGVSPLSATIGEDRTLRWSQGVIPYEIDPALPNPQRVLDAIAHWHANTGIRLVPRKAQTDYVLFVVGQDGATCYSALGRKGGTQVIGLASTCSVSSTIHEIGHAVGLYHEQSRQDRDRHIQILWQNIDSRRWGNFATYNVGQDLGPYDTSSIMHYGSFTFSINGEPTILQRDGSYIPSSRPVLTARDIWGVGTLYDEVAPVLGLEGPADRALVRSVVSAQVSASDDRFLKAVEVHEDGVPVSQQQGSFTYAWHTERLPDGLHTLRAIARDGGGNTASRTLTVETDNTPPQVSFESPTGETILRGQATFSAYASDAHGVSSFSFHLVPEGVQDPTWSALRVSAPYAFTLDTLALPNGTYQLQAVAEDGPGNTSRASVPVIIQNARVVLAASLGVKVWGTLPLEAEVESRLPIVAVDFLVDGERLASVTRAPYALAWDTGGTREGTRLVSRSITAVARDAAGTILGRSAPRQVVVLCPAEGEGCG